MPNNNETTTKFKVDISELKKSMQEAKRQVALANSEFKAASAGMDNWSKSTDGISAKLKQLDSNLTSQKTVLAQYEKTLEDVKAQYGENSKEAQDYQIKLNNQKAVVNNLEKEIKKYKSALEKAEKAEEIAADTGRDASEVFDELGRSAEDAGESAESSSGGWTVLKGALADLVADGIRAVGDALKDLVTDSSEAYAQFSAATGVATEAMGEYEEAIKNVYKNNFGESLSDVAEKMAKVKEITGELDASKLQDMTEKAITLEDVFGMDMTETLRGVQSLMTHFGMTSEEAFDLIAAGAQSGLNYTDELGDNVSEYAGKFAEAGYSSEEYFQLLKNGSQGGSYNLDKVNDAINEITARLADGTIEDGIGGFSESTQDLFKAWQNGEATQKQVIDSIVGDIQNTTGEQEKMNLAALAFGTMAEDGGTKFIESLSAVGNTYDDVQGKADELANTKYDTPAAAISGIGRTLKTDLLQPLVDKLLPYLQQLADWVTENLPEIKAQLEPIVDKVGELITWIVDNKDLVIAGLAGIAAGLAAFNVVSMIQGLVKSFQAFKVAQEGATVAQWLLNAAMNANPIGILVALIVGLVAAFVVLWKKSDAFREFWIGLWEKIKTLTSKAVQTISKFFTETIPKALDKMLTFLKELPSKVWTWLLATINKVITWRNDMVAKAKEAASGFLDKIVEFIKNLPSKVWTWLSNTITKVTTFASNLKTKGAEAAKNLFNSIVDGITSLPEKIKGIGSDVVKGLWNGINDMTSWIKDKISGFGDSVVSGLKDFFGIHSPSKLMADEIGKFIPEGIAVGVDKNAKSVLKSMKDLTSDAVVSARSGLNSASNSLNSSGAVGGVVNNFYQTNNSPKALSRLDIYRQSKNLLGYVGGVS